MSGGSMNYIYCRFEEEVVGHMHDVELDEMMQDIAELLHDCEWWHSGDICEDTYRKTVKKFKAKWLQGGSCRTKRLEKIIDDRLVAVRKELRQAIGAEG